MSYIFKFENNDIFINSIKSHPRVEFQIYQGISYYNNILPHPGAFTTSSIYCAPKGYISLFEQNIDRSGSSGLEEFSGTRTANGNAVLPVFELAVPQRTDKGWYSGDTGGNGFPPERYYENPEYPDTDPSSAGNPIIQPFIIKDGTRTAFRTTTIRDFNSTEGGAVMTHKYPLTASISKEYYSATTPRAAGFQAAPTLGGGAPAAYTNGSVSHLLALKNVMNSHKKLSPYYTFYSTVEPRVRDLGAPGDPTERAEGTAVPVGLVSIPSIFYGSSIQKGTVNLKTFISGALAAELRDINRNGELIQVGPTGSTSSGSVAGVVLYDEGFLVLTGSWKIDGTHQESYTTAGADYPRWTNFAQTISGSNAFGDASALTISTPSSSYFLGFNGTTRTPALTMLAHAKKNELNHSNNPTCVSASKGNIFSSGGKGYVENMELGIKNTVSASYNTPTGSFEKTTYISQIGIFDENQNLLGVAKLATPVKKTEDRQFTFKLKLDI